MVDLVNRRRAGHKMDVYSTEQIDLIASADAALKRHEKASADHGTSRRRKAKYQLERLGSVTRCDKSNSLGQRSAGERNGPSGSDARGSGAVTAADAASRASSRSSGSDARGSGAASAAAAASRARSHASQAQRASASAKSHRSAASSDEDCSSPERGGSGSDSDCDISDVYGGDDDDGAEDDAEDREPRRRQKPGKRKRQGGNSIIEQFAEQSRKEQQMLDKWMAAASTSTAASSEPAASSQPASSFTFNTQDLSSAATIIEETVRAAEVESPAASANLADLELALLAGVQKNPTVLGSVSTILRRQNHPAGQRLWRLLRMCDEVSNTTVDRAQQWPVLFEAQRKVP